MNHYGARAKKHWQTHLPNRYQTLNDPEIFFTELGEQISMQVRDLTETIAGEDPAGEAYLDKMGRLKMAKLEAESQVLQELALIDPETSEASTQS